MRVFASEDIIAVIARWDISRLQWNLIMLVVGIFSTACFHYKQYIETQNKHLDLIEIRQNVLIVSTEFAKIVLQEKS